MVFFNILGVVSLVFDLFFQRNYYNILYKTLCLLFGVWFLIYTGEIRECGRKCNMVFKLYKNHIDVEGKVLIKIDHKMWINNVVTVIMAIGQKK